MSDPREKLPLDSPLAARWSLYAAHALSGLLANSSEGFGARDGIDWAKRAAEYADDLLALHNERFRAPARVMPAPNVRSPEPPRGSASPPQAGAPPRR